MFSKHIASIPVHETALNLYLGQAEEVHKFTRDCFQFFSLSRIYIFIFTEDIFSYTDSVEVKTPPQVSTIKQVIVMEELIQMSKMTSSVKIISKDAF